MGSSMPLRPASLARLGLLSATLAAACTPTTPATPHAQVDGRLAASFASAFDAEAQDSLAAAKYLDVVDQAVASPESPDALAVAVAALDALVFREIDAVGLGGRQGLAYRSRELMPQIVDRLRAAWTRAGQRLEDDPGSGGRLPIVRGLVASALHELSLYAGQEQPSMIWGERHGCAQEAALVAPLDWTPLRGLEDPSPIAPTGAFAEAYAGAKPFYARVAPQVIHADACQLDVNATFALPGVRALVVDIDNPQDQRVFVALSTTSAAVLDLGGVRMIRRGFEAGNSGVTRLASAHLPTGRARVVVRVGQMSDGDAIELDVWGEDGNPLRLRAPRTGDVASARPTAVTPIEIAPAGPSAEALAVAAAGLLGLGETRAAEHLLEERTGPEGASPRLLLLAARATEGADDLPDTKQADRIRSLAAKVLDAWPKAWEAQVIRAQLTERRRSSGEGLADAFKELGVAPPSAQEKAPTLDPMVLAYVASAARRGDILDLSEDAYRKLEQALPGSPLLARADAALHGRVGMDAVKAACEGGLSRAEYACLWAMQQRGDARGALNELARLRRLRNAPDAQRDVETTLHVMTGDLDAVIAAYDATPPARRHMTDALGFAAGRNRPDLVRPRLARDLLVARDTPYALPIIGRILSLEPEVTPALEAQGKALVEEDRKKNAMPDAGTAVLRHVERYDLAESGLLRYVVYDLRRVSGTTDVAEGAVSYGPVIEANATQRLLRRRIHKKDGRIVEPDQVAMAAQSHSDLSQLEQGDYVEQVLEGYCIPDAGGQMVIDTPDLMPQRTGVREAEIELRRPASLGATLGLWAHPLLGKPEERVEGGVKISRWKLVDRNARIIEAGAPRMEQSVSLSFGTQTWANVGRNLDDHLRALEDKDPYIARFAREAAGDAKTPSRTLVERVVAAVGKRVKIASGGDLSDVSAVYGAGPQRTTARTVLELGTGSRALVVYRALRELGVDARIAVAETEPFSAAADFPPHVGRFHYPLVIARLPEGDLWIDADVDGPPLPPGRISPELRGRVAMLPDGRTVTVQGQVIDGGDDIDVRLVLDDKGDARGTCNIVMQGRVAQAVADALETRVGTERRDMLRDLVLGWLPWADVEDVALSSGEGSWEVAVKATVAIHGFAQPEGKDGKVWVLPGFEPVHAPRGGGSTLGATYASSGERQDALSIDTAIQYHVRRRIELPAGVTLARAPTETRVADPHIEASRKGTYADRVVEEDFRLSLPTGTVSAEDYDQFVERVHAVDDGFMTGTRVRVKP
jgi:hypothetical protein